LHSHLFMWSHAPPGTFHPSRTKQERTKKGARWRYQCHGNNEMPSSASYSNIILADVSTNLDFFSRSNCSRMKTPCSGYLHHPEGRWSADSWRSLAPVRIFPARPRWPTVVATESCESMIAFGALPSLFIQLNAPPYIPPPWVIPTPYASRCVLFQPIETPSLFLHHETSKDLVNELDDYKLSE
jgi:hypothetical protein